VRLVRVVLVSEPEVSSLDKVEVLVDVVQQVLPTRSTLNFLNELLLVQKDDLDVEGFGRAKAAHSPLPSHLTFKQIISLAINHGSTG